MGTLLKSVNFDGYNGSHFYLQLYYDIVEQSIENNKTKVHFDLYVGSKDGYSASGSSATGYINDGAVGSITSIGVNAWQWVGSRELWYTHNEDGTLTNAWYGAGLYTNWNGVGGAGMGGYFSLPKINRYAMITTANAYTDEENPTMEFTNNLMYDLRAKLKVGNEVIYNQDLSDSSVTNYTFELTTAQRTRLRELCTGQYLSTTFQIISLEGTTEKYTSEKAVQMNIVNANPTYTYSVVETNAKVISALGSSSASSIIDNVSQVKISVTPTTYKEATVSRFWVKHDNKEYQDDTSPYEITIPITTDRFSFNVVDSRGLSGTTNLLIKTLIEYEPIKINSYTFKRENPISSNVILNLDVLYYNSFGSITNIPVVKWKLADGTYTTIPSSYYTIDSTNHKLTISNYEISNVLPYNQQGQFTIYIEDKLTTAEETGANGLVLKGVATFEAGEHDLQVNGDLYIADINRENITNVKDLHKVEITTGDSPVKTGRIIDGEEEYVKRLQVTGLNGTTGDHNVDISSLNISSVIKIEGIKVGNTGNKFPIANGSSNAPAFDMMVLVNNANSTLTVRTYNQNFSYADIELYYI